jgi:hypothetical protein
MKVSIRKHPGRAAAAGVGSGLLYVALPYVAITFVLSYLDAWAQDPNNPANLTPIILGLQEMRRNVIIFGGGLTAFSAMRALYPKGAPHRAGFGIGRQGFKYGYLAVVLAGGVWALELPLSLEGLGSYGGFSAALDLSPIFTLLYFAVAVTAVHGVLEYLVYRRTLRPPEGYASSFGEGGDSYWAPPPPEDDILGR